MASHFPLPFRLATLIVTAVWIWGAILRISTSLKIVSLAAAHNGQLPMMLTAIEGRPTPHTTLSCSRTTERSPNRPAPPVHLPLRSRSHDFPDISIRPILDVDLLRILKHAHSPLGESHIAHNDWCSGSAPQIFHTLRPLETAPYRRQSRYRRSSQERRWEIRRRPVRRHTHIVCQAYIRDLHCLLYDIHRAKSDRGNG